MSTKKRRLEECRNGRREREEEKLDTLSRHVLLLEGELSVDARDELVQRLLQQQSSRKVKAGAL